MKAVTHNARFHSDDVCAAAVLSLVYPHIQFTRTRDADLISAADIVFDVGTQYDETALRFDHHQEGGAGARENGIPYASFGLVWKRYGRELCDGDETIARRVDTRFVQPIDAMDNGIDLYAVREGKPIPYVIQSAVVSMNPTWMEDESLADKHFLQATEVAKHILLREIAHASAAEAAARNVEEAYRQVEDKRLIVLDVNYPYAEVLMKYEEPLYVVLPNRQSSDWKVECIPSVQASYANRKKLPASWAGKRDAELETITGVEGARFCHNMRFLAAAKTKEAARALAWIAIHAPIEV